MVMKNKFFGLYKSVIGSVEYALRGFSYAPDELVVLCMHSTPSDRLKDFEVLIDFLGRHFHPLHPDELPAYCKGELREGPYILYTFDDGLRNNLEASKLLSRKNIAAFFFVVPAFIDAPDGKKYYLENIRPVVDPSYDKEEEDFTPIDYEGLKSMAMQGHRIGSHTMTHLLHAGMKEDAVKTEIEGSKQRLAEKTGKDISAFCSPNNTAFSMNVIAKKLVAEHYRFHFTTFPGLNAAAKDPQLIFRRNIELNWSPGRIKFALGRWDLPRWAQLIQQFRSQ
jgi:peptidoglycan/xylan/chitin deacetylase (PgdA/CDA1 family)